MTEYFSYTYGFLVLRRREEVWNLKWSPEAQYVGFHHKPTFNIKNKLVTEIGADGSVSVQSPLLPELPMFRP